MSFAVPVLISARNRPLYLWATLDNLYRRTRHPHKFILLDMASEDPSVRQVIAGFERRGMFDEIVWAERNDPKIIWSKIWQISNQGAPYLGYVESDVVVETVNPCWLESLVGLMEKNPRLAMLGAAIDQDDFVDLETARRIGGQIPDSQLRALIKADSPERMQDLSCVNGADIFHPHNPPGRLVLVRNSALQEVGPGTDGQLHDKFLAAGYETGIATAVRHRHLSLLNISDYPEHDTDARDRFMTGVATLSRDSVTNFGTGRSDENLHVKTRPLSTYFTRFRSYLASVSMRPKWRSKVAVTHISARSRSSSS
jgi:hypothetical protein